MFLNGLREDIRAEVQLYEPRLAGAITKAFMIEDKNMAVTKLMVNTGTRQANS